MECVGLSPIPNVVFSFAERFSRNLLGAFHTFSFLNRLAERGLTLLLLSPFLADSILFRISPKALMGPLFSPAKYTPQLGKQSRGPAPAAVKTGESGE